ncbi:MAG: dTDP-4-dehydrorhamnose 3,5-epimerase family protein [Gemmataceae bacterium]
MEFKPGPIEGVIWRPLKKFHDQRGWLCELFRNDELPQEYIPVMCYVSVTEPGVARGPHEHVDQADYFCFYGPSNFKMYLWDNRPQSKTYRNVETRVVGADDPMALVVPVGVVHAYRNVGEVPGLVLNAANRLYKGWGRKEPVDEIRHEEHVGTVFKLD